MSHHIVQHGQYAVTCSIQIVEDQVGSRLVAAKF